MVFFFSRRIIDVYYVGKECTQYNILSGGKNLTNQQGVWVLVSGFLRSSVAACMVIYKDYFCTTVTPNKLYGFTYSPMIQVT